jgi:hypothetical protein
MFVFAPCIRDTGLCSIAHLPLNLTGKTAESLFSAGRVAPIRSKLWKSSVKARAVRGPDSEVAEQLDSEFDQLFSTKTGYDQLDERISKTKKKKKSLLMVLTVPEIPLHNNAAELAARVKVRKRDVSLQTVTKKGTKANDTFMTIVQTAKKLSVSAYDNILDRISNKFEMTSLTQLIREKKN